MISGLCDQDIGQHILYLRGEAGIGADAGVSDQTPEGCGDDLIAPDRVMLAWGCINPGIDFRDGHLGWAFGWRNAGLMLDRVVVGGSCLSDGDEGTKPYQFRGISGECDRLGLRCWVGRGRGVER